MVEQKKKLVVIDSDFITFIACNGVKLLDSSGDPIKEDGKFVYRDKELDEATSQIDNTIKNILLTLGADCYIGYLTGTNNFRKKINPLYKSNRVLERPKLFNEVRQYMVKQWGFIVVDTLESDDVCIITRKRLSNQYDVVVVAVDKDVLWTEGTNFNPKKQELLTITKEQEDKQLWFDMIIGQRGDFVLGIEGKGEKFAEKLYQESSDPTRVLPNHILDTFRANILCSYIDRYGEYKGIENFYKNYFSLKLLEEYEDFKTPEPIKWNIWNDDLFVDDIDEFEERISEE